MHHVAIMKKSWGLTEKILSGNKTIESRWYKFKHKPWNSVKKGDTIYFKNSGEPVKIKADVSNVLQFSGLNEDKIKDIFMKYGKAIGISGFDVDNFLDSHKDHKYCLLIFLKNPMKTEPFDINKKGFGAMSAWISVDDIERIKIKN